MLFLSTGIAGFADDEMMGDEFQVVGRLCGDSGVEMYTGFLIEIPDDLLDCLVALEPGTTKWEWDGDDDDYVCPSNGTHIDPYWKRGDPLPEGTTHMLATGK